MGLEGSEKPASSVPETTEVKPTDSTSTSTSTTTATTPKQEALDSKDESGLSAPAERAAPASRADSEKTAVREEQEEAIAKREDETPITTDEKAGDSTEEDDESKYPSGVTLAILTIGLCLSTFVIALGMSSNVWAWILTLNGAF